jgi:hypothetical protein
MRQSGQTMTAPAQFVVKATTAAHFVAHGMPLKSTMTNVLEYIVFF